MRISDWSSDVCSSDLQLSKRAPETVPSFFGSSSIHGAHDESLAQVPAGRRVLAAGSRFSLRRTSPAFAGAGSVLSRARALHGARVAAPGRPDTAHAGVTIRALVEAPSVGAPFPTAPSLPSQMNKHLHALAAQASRPGAGDKR